MASKFNPYAEWFGLNPSSKPTYYELLGVPNFETEPPVIAEAAELRLQLLQAHRGGPHADTADRLSREVTGVMNVLLSPDKRRQYDDQLRQQQPALHAPATTSLDAADSPTMMLPPGALQIPPMSAPAAAAPPTTNPYGAYPGYDPAYAGYGAQPQAAQPNYGGAPNYAAAPTGFPNAAPGMMPAAVAPQYAPAAAYPSAAAPYGQAAAPAGYPGFAPAAQPGFAAAPQTMQATLPVAGGATYSNSNVSQRTRLAGAKKQKSSHTMMATAIIGGAGVVLFLLILAVSASLNKTKVSQAQPKVVAKRPNQMPQDPSLNQFEKAMMSMPPALESYDDNGNPGFMYRSTPDEVLKNEARMRDMPNSEGAFGGMTMPDLITKMAPKGVTPSIATTPPPAAVPSATPPSFTNPPPPAAVPSATPVSAPTTTPAPSMPSPGPVLTGLAPADVKMEAALPPDVAREKSVQTMFGAIRTALKKRDYAKAEEIALQTQVMADTPALITTAYEHGRVVEHIRVFWTAVREGAKALTEGEELTFAGKASKVVKHDDLSIVIKQDNKDVVLQIDKLLPGLAVMLAERGLPPNDPATKIAVACFLASDQAGDRDKAMLLLSEAGAAGSDVTNLKAALSDSP